jgi:AcrR family transcriptional regulator
LTQAFTDLLREKRFQSITVQEIAERATVNRATFYAHFEDKYALLNYAIRETFRRRLAARLPEGAILNSENLRVLIQTMCEVMVEFHRQFLPADQQLLPLFETSITAELNDVLLSWLREIVAGQPSSGAPPEVAAVLMSWAIYGAAVQWHRKIGPGTVQEYISQVVTMIMAAVESVYPRAPSPN